MDIGGQGNVNRERQSKRPCSELDAGGFTMVVLLVVMAVMAVGMSAMLPTWRQQAIREQEEELIFRGNQYARALVLYSRKNSNLLPSDIDVLYTGKYLRKKYKDPITGEAFGLMPAGQPQGMAGRGPTGGPQNPGGAGRGGGPARGTGPSQTGRGAPSGTQLSGSIQGVYSKSTDTSIRVYQNQQRYIDWPFTVQTAQLMMGQARGIGPGPADRGGGPGDGRGGPRGIGPGGAPGRGGELPPGRGGPPAPGQTGGRGRGGG